jgi:hypothetical protein
VFERKAVKPYVVRKCGDKIKYPSYSTAFIAAKGIFRTNGHKLTPYQCPICSKYHIGHQRHDADLSTAFVPLVPPRPKKQPKPPKVKAVKVPAVKQLNVSASVGIAIRKSDHEWLMAEQTRAAQERREERQRAHEKLMALRQGSREVGGYGWLVAMDDGWNQHL